MAWTYEITTDLIIPNVVIEKGFLDGVHKIYVLSAVDGYVLHDNVTNHYDMDGNIVHMYSVGTCTCGANYDFSTAQLTVPDINGNDVIVTAYGSREFFAFPENLVPDPENNIYGVGDNDHEVESQENAETI